MSDLPEQFSEARKLQIDTQLTFFSSLTSKAFDSVEKVMACHFDAARATLAQSSALMRQMFEVKTPGALFALNQQTPSPFNSALAYGQQLLDIAAGAAAPVGTTIAPTVTAESAVTIVPTTASLAAIVPTPVEAPVEAPIEAPEAVAVNLASVMPAPEVVAVAKAAAMPAPVAAPKAVAPPKAQAVPKAVAFPKASTVGTAVAFPKGNKVVAPAATPKPVAAPFILPASVKPVAVAQVKPVSAPEQVAMPTSLTKQAAAKPARKK